MAKSHKVNDIQIISDDLLSNLLWLSASSQGYTQYFL